MRMLLTKSKSYNIVLTKLIVPLTLFPLCLLFLVRLGVYTVNSFDFYFLQVHRETDRFLPASTFQVV